jgi:hypothetical protein
MKSNGDPDSLGVIVGDFSSVSRILDKLTIYVSGKPLSLEYP